MEDRRPPSPEPHEADILARLEALPGELGFSENDELTLIKSAAVEASESGDIEEVNALVLQYSLAGERLIDDKLSQGHVHEQLLIGFYIATGLMRRDVGKRESYYEDLEVALAYADDRGYREVAEIIEISLDKEQRH